MKKLLNLHRNSWLTLIGCPLFTLRERALLFVRSLCNTNKGRTSLRRGYLYKGNKARYKVMSCTSYSPATPYNSTNIYQGGNDV
jgi:hypothetical protein